MVDQLDPVLTSAGYLVLKAGTQFHALIDEALGRVLGVRDLEPDELALVVGFRFRSRIRRRNDSNGVP